MSCKNPCHTMPNYTCVHLVRGSDPKLCKILPGTITVRCHPAAEQILKQLALAWKEGEVWQQSLPTVLLPNSQADSVILEQVECARLYATRRTRNLNITDAILGEGRARGAYKQGDKLPSAPLQRTVEPTRRPNKPQIVQRKRPTSQESLSFADAFARALEAEDNYGGRGGF